MDSIHGYKHIADTAHSRAELEVNGMRKIEAHKEWQKTHLEWELRPKRAVGHVRPLSPPFLDDAQHTAELSTHTHVHVHSWAELIWVRIEWELTHTHTAITCKMRPKRPVMCEHVFKVALCTLSPLHDDVQNTHRAELSDDGMRNTQVNIEWQITHVHHSHLMSCIIIGQMWFSLWSSLSHVWIRRMVLTSRH